MNIKNDQIIFDASDIALFSDAFQKAVALYIGSRDGETPPAPEEVMSDFVNNGFVAPALSVLKASRVAQVQPIIDALVSADPATQAAAQPALDQLAQALKVPTVKVPQEIATPIADTPQLAQSQKAR